jgi:hypothetical protein
MARAGFDTHAVRWNMPNNGRKSLSLCGEWVDGRDVVREQPSCFECQTELAKDASTPDLSVEDVFGEPTSGTQVRPTHIDTMAGYRPKGARS